MPPGIQWSAVCRDNIILAESGEDNYDGKVIQIAEKLIRKKPTAGWEFEKSRRHKLTGIKFHVFEHFIEYDSESEKPCEKMYIWSFAAIAESSLEDIEIKSFLEKLVYITEPMRGQYTEWRYGDSLAAQASFAPILRQRMEQVAHDGRMAMVNESISTCKDIMARNIEMELQRGALLESLAGEAEELSAMAKQFKKRGKQLKRFKMWNNAKYGVILGGTVTAVVAAVTVPPLVAIL
jgi:hypothetical protein